MKYITTRRFFFDRTIRNLYLIIPGSLERLFSELSFSDISLWNWCEFIAFKGYTERFWRFSKKEQRCMK